MVRVLGRAMGWGVVALLNRAGDAARLKNADIAEKLELTEGRVSQVMNSDGNLHIATIGRFLRACGYELELLPRPVEAGLPELNRGFGRRVRADMFTQCYLTPGGVLNKVAIVHNHDSDNGAVPVGGPKHRATSARKQSGWEFIDAPAQDWVELTDEAVHAEEPERVAGPMTSRTDETGSVSTADIVRAIRLDSLVLWECSVERGDADPEPGKVSAELHVERYSGEHHAQYTLTTDYLFENDDDERVVSIKLVYVASYDLGEYESLTDEQSERFAKSVVMQATPFQREMLASLTNRLGLPTFYLPLIRKSEVTFQGAAQDESAQPRR